MFIYAHIFIYIYIYITVKCLPRFAKQLRYKLHVPSSMIDTSFIVISLVDYIATEVAGVNLFLNKWRLYN